MIIQFTPKKRCLATAQRSKRISGVLERDLASAKGLHRADNAFIYILI
ncbi:MAG: hypothetical protein ACLQT5_15725 [Steroidobacteraceae bacterium]|jgi:hypothetical protein